MQSIFEKITKNSKNSGQAHIGMRYIKAVCDVERYAKRHNMTPAERLALRIEKSKSIMEDFGKWLNNVAPYSMIKSDIGVAVNYCLNHWEGLNRFLEDGRLEIDNNLTEQKIKPFVMARKNFLFAASQAGADAICLHFSLIQTAKLHGLDPYDYYVHILKTLALCQSQAEIEALLPWNFKKLAEKYAKAA